MENSTEVPQKIKNRTTIWSSNSTSEYLSENKTKTKTLTQKAICTHMFIAALFTIAKIWKQPKCSSMNEWRSCEMCIYISFSHRKWGNPIICNNMDGPWRHYAKWNKKEKDKYCTMSLICGISKNKKQKKNLLDAKIRFVITRGRVGVGELKEGSQEGTNSHL